MKFGESAKNNFIKATSILVGGSVIGQLVTILASPIISRLYSKAEVGHLGTFATVLTCIAPIICLRFEAAISLPKEEESSARLVLLSLLSTLVVSIVSGALILAFANPICQALKDSTLKGFLWLVPISLLGIGLYTSFSYWCLREKHFKVVAKTRILQGFSQATSQLLLGLLKFGSMGLILGDVFGRILGGSTMALMAWRQIRKVPNLLIAKELKKTAKQFREFPLYAAPANFLHNLTTNFTLILSAIYGAELYGLYFFGIRFIWSPLALVGQAMAQVYLADASQWARDNPARVLRAFDQISRKLAIACAIPFAILMLFGAPITSLIFGHRWIEAGFLVQIQALSWWVMFVVGPTINTLNIFGKQKWQLWIDVFGLLMMAIGFWVSVRYGLSARWAVGIYSTAIVLMYVLLFVYSRKAIVLSLNPATEANS